MKVERLPSWDSGGRCWIRYWPKSGEAVFFTKAETSGRRSAKSSAELCGSESPSLESDTGALRRTRGAVAGFSPQSRKRMRRYLENTIEPYKVMLTLTYGRDYPLDIRVCKRHLSRFWELCKRRGYMRAGDSAFWFQEFQRRGAWHCHAYLTFRIPYRAVAEMWHLATYGQSSVKAGTSIERMRSKGVSYALKYAVKSDQKSIPCGVVNTGRWWGVVGSSRIIEPVVAATQNFGLQRQIAGFAGRFVSVAFVETFSGVECVPKWCRVVPAERSAVLEMVKKYEISFAERVLPSSLPTKPEKTAPCQSGHGRTCGEGVPNWQRRPCPPLHGYQPGWSGRGEGLPVRV